MASSPYIAKIVSSISSVGHWITESVLNPLGLLQIGIAGFTFFLAWLFAKRIREFLKRKTWPSLSHLHFRFDPAQFALVTQFVLWLFALWFFQALFAKLKLPSDALHVAFHLSLLLLAVRFAAFYIRKIFWVRVFYSVCATVIVLRMFDLWSPTVHLLESMTIVLGTISFSLWAFIKAMTVFIVLWVAGSVTNRFFGHWLSASPNLNYSDRVLIQRVSKTCIAALVILVSLHAAGIHMTAIAVTGGAMGVAIGLGLQKLGSNLISGIHLLLSKPIRRGDVIQLKGALGEKGSVYGWITRMGLMYVQVATRDGTEQLIPNEVFLTHKIENLSYSDNRVRLHIPFGIAYKSDLNKAMALALEAARGTERVLKAPEPICIVTAFGDSNVMLEVRVWIEDPRQGFRRVQSKVYLAIWDNFHNNGIQFAYPQRDLHIIDGGPSDDIGLSAKSPPPAKLET